MTYHVSEAAKVDLKRIYFEGSDLFGEAQAITYLKGIEAMFETLAQFPRMARLRTEISPPAHGHPYKSHLIFYDIHGDDVIEIIRVRHSAEDWLSDMNELPQ